MVLFNVLEEKHGTYWIIHIEKSHSFIFWTEGHKSPGFLGSIFSELSIVGYP